MTGTRSVVVDDRRCSLLPGSDCGVYATPRMLSDMEGTCRDLLLEHLDPGEDSVGTHATLDHVAATPLGMNVTIEAVVVSIDGRSVTFDLVARDSLEECGRARHVRYVVAIERRMRRLADKRTNFERISKENDT